jgi:hypothetical protein
MMTDHTAPAPEWMLKIKEIVTRLAGTNEAERRPVYDKIAKAYGDQAATTAAELFTQQAAAQQELDALMKAAPPHLPVKRGVPSLSVPVLQSAIPLGFQYRRSPNGYASSLMNAEYAIDQLGIDCRYDEFHDKMILNAKAFSIDAAVFENLDNFTKVFRREVARRFGFELTPRDALDALTLRCFEHKFDPVRDYLDGLVWDSCERIDRWLIDYCGAEDTPLNRAFSRKVLVAGVRRVRQPGCKFDYILVLEGAQGAGKSSLLKILAGEENCSDSEILGADAREQQELTRGVWIYEIGELVGLTKADVNHIKLFASKQVDSARAAYDRGRTDRKRRGIFIATTNENKYLRDATGNRRFWPVKVRQIDLAGVAADRDQLWAEAAAIEAGGEPLVIPEAQWSDAAAAQGERMEHDPWSDLIDKKIGQLCDAVIAGKLSTGYLAGKFGWGVNPDTGNREWRASSAYLLEEVCRVTPDRQASYHFKRLADVMTSLGWRKPSNVIRIGSSQPCHGFTISAEPED